MLVAHLFHGRNGRGSLEYLSGHSPKKIGTVHDRADVVGHGSLGSCRFRQSFRVFSIAQNQGRNSRCASQVGGGRTRPFRAPSHGKLTEGGLRGLVIIAIVMTENSDKKKEPDSKRLEAFRELPVDILEKLTKEEVRAFIYDDEWPDSLREKLKDYLVDDK